MEQEIKDVHIFSFPFIVAVRNEKAGEVVSRLKNDRKEFYAGLDKLLVDELHLMSRIDYERNTRILNGSIL